MQKIVFAGMIALALSACSAGGKNSDAANRAEASAAVAPPAVKVTFDADSAYSYVEKQVKFGPRVNNTEAHRKTSQWLASELRRHGAEVSLQEMQLTDFEDTALDAVNIIGSYNPSATERLLLVAHWDSRPWADNDPDEANHEKPVDGANDGASGVGVLLELARQMGLKNPGRGVDILFVDAEDRGNHEDDDSWALGAQYFVDNPFKKGYVPSEVILLDMVGGRGARFHREYFSSQYASELLQRVWALGQASGFSAFFVDEPGGGVNDDHVRFLAAGIPAIDIIEFNPNTESHFNETWHTVRDNMDNIDRATLKAVGQTVANYIYRDE